MVLKSQWKFNFQWEIGIWCVYVEEHSDIWGIWWRNWEKHEPHIPSLSPCFMICETEIWATTPNLITNQNRVLGTSNLRVLVQGEGACWQMSFLVCWDFASDLRSQRFIPGGQKLTKLQSIYQIQEVCFCNIKSQLPCSQIVLVDHPFWGIKITRDQSTDDGLGFIQANNVGSLSGFPNNVAFTLRDFGNRLNKNQVTTFWFLV